MRRDRIQDHDGKWIYWNGDDKTFVDWTLRKLDEYYGDPYYRKAEPVVRRGAVPKVRLNRPVGRPRLNQFEKYGQTFDVVEAAHTVHRIYLIWKDHFGRKNRNRKKRQSTAVDVAVEYFKSLGIKVTAEAVANELYRRHL